MNFLVCKRFVFIAIVCCCSTVNAQNSDAWAELATKVVARATPALAVTGAKRTMALPDVPTVAESGVPGYEFSSWFGFVVPKGTPADIVHRINSAALTALKTPQVSERLLSGMTQPVGSTPLAFAQLIQQENTRWGKLIKQYNVKAD